MPDDALETLREQLELREQQLIAVHRISAALASKNDIDSLLRETLRVSLETVDADAGSLLLYDTAELNLVFAHVIGKTELLGQKIDPERDVTGKAATVFRTGRSLLTVDTQSEGYNSRFDQETGYRTQSILTVPLMNQGDTPIGVMQALNKRHGQFDSGDQDLLEIIGCLAATAIVNARLAKEAQLAAVARAVGDLGHDIKNALTPIESMVDTTIDLFIKPMFEQIDLILQQHEPEASGLSAALLDATAALRTWYPEVNSSVKDGCADIREMVSEIADYIKGTQATHIVENDLQKVIENRLRRLRVLAQTRHIDLQVEGLEDVPRFAFDRRLVGRAVYNLVNNALAAIDEAVKQGTLQFRTFHIRVSAYTLREGFFPEGNFCYLEVQDDGPGISDHVKRSLFTPNAISTTPGGTGIGTRFVNDVVEAHHGLVGVESEPGAGATFWLKLPLIPDKEGD